MKKALKWTGITLLVLILLIIIAPFIFKDKIIAKVKEEANNSLNAKVDFGKFDLTLISSFPQFTFSIDDVSVANIGEFEGDTLFSTKNLTLSLDLMSVIKGEQYSIRSIVIDHPRINAIVLKNGKANWDIAKADSTQPAKPEEASEPTKFKMKLSKLEIKNAYLAYSDATMPFSMELVDMNHTLSGDFTQDNFVLKTLTEIAQTSMNYGGVGYLTKAKVAIKADMDADMPNFKFTFKENEIALNELSFGVDGFVAMPKEDIDMDIKFKANQAEFKSFLSLIPAVYSKDFASVKTSGKLAFDGYAKGTYNDKVMPAFGVHVLIDDAMFQYPSLPKAVKDIQVDIKVDNKDGVPDNTVININKIHVEMADNPVDIKMLITTPVSDANINGTILGKVNLASLKDIVPVEKGDDLKGNITADLKLAGRVSKLEQGKYDEFNASGQLIVMDVNYKSEKDKLDVLVKSMTLNFNPKNVELAGFDAQMGASDIQANGKIDNLLQYVFKKELLTGTFNVKSNLMDLNQFMTADAAPTETPTTTAPADTTPMSVIAIPANIDFTLNVDMKKLLYTNMEITDFNGAVVVKDSRASLSNIKLKTLGGSIGLNGFYDTKNEKSPDVSMKLNVVDIDIPSTYKTFNTIKKLAPIAQYARGAVSTTLNVTTKLDSKMQPLMNSIKGDGTLQTKSVALDGFEPINKLAEALKMDKLKRMQLNNVNFSYDIVDGKVIVKPFDVKVENVKARISGSNSFDQTIDYVWDMQIPRAMLGGDANQLLNGLVSKANSNGANVSLGETINIKALIGGTVTKPVIKTDLKGAANDLKEDLKAKAKEEFDKKKKELEDQAKAEAEKLKKEAEDRVKAEADRIKKEAEDKVKAEAEKAKNKLKDEAKDKLKGLFGK